MSPVGRLVFNTSEAFYKRLVGSTPTSSATILAALLWSGRATASNQQQGGPWF